MAKKGKIHNIRDIFTNMNLLEGATISQSDNGTFKIDGFTIIKAGMSANGNYYPSDTLRKAAGAGVFNEKTIRTDHPDARPHSVKDIVGKIEKTWFNEQTQSLRGSGFLSSTADDLVTKAQEGLIGDLSINALGVTVIERYSGDKLRRNVKEIKKGYSVDLVCEAAAGGSLQEDYQKNKELCERMKNLMDELEKLTIEELKEARPDLVKKLQEEVKVPPLKKKDDGKGDEARITADEVKTLVTEAVGTAFKSRDDVLAEETKKRLLLEGIGEAIEKTLEESGAADSIKSFVGKAMIPFATKNFETLDSIDNVKLSEERDRVMADFDALVKEHVNAPPNSDTQIKGGGKRKRMVELMIV